MGLREEPIGVVRNIEELRQFFGSIPGNSSRRQDDEVRFHLDLLTGQGIGSPDDQLATLLIDLGHSSPDVDRPCFCLGFLIEFFVTFARGPDVDIEDVGLTVRNVVLDKDRLFGCVHTADSRTVGHPLGLIPRPSALYENHPLRLLIIGRPNHVSPCGA